MSASALYWFLQFLGWGAFLVINFAFVVAGGPHFPSGPVASTMGFCSISGLLVTHLWRNWIKHRHYLEMPFSRCWRRFFAGTLLIAVLLTLLASVWYRLFLVPDTFRRTDWVPYALMTWTFTVAIWTLIYISIANSRRATVLERQRLQTDVLARDARLEVLRQQLNPHFLFNSLNSLRALIFEDADKASHMVDRLAALLRYSLTSNSSELVTLAEELVMVNEYLSIEKIRFEDRLRVDMNISGDTNNAQLPRMLLQTLVENAVRHGIERSITGGTLTVVTSIQDQCLHITVQNPGTLALGSSSTRLGLKNAQQRLALLCGSRASLRIHQLGMDVEALLVIPQ